MIAVHEASTVFAFTVFASTVLACTAIAEWFDVDALDEAHVILLMRMCIRLMANP